MTTPRRREALAEYLRVLRDLMRLQAWDIDVVEAAPDSDDAILEIVPKPLRHWAKVRIGSFFTNDPAIVTGPEEQRQTAVHELIHLTHARLWEWLDQGILRDQLAAPVAHMLEQLITEEIEVQTDALARVLAPFMPLPPAWPDA